MSTILASVTEELNFSMVFDWSLQLCTEQKSAVLADAGDVGKQLARDVDGAVACGNRDGNT